MPALSPQVFQILLSLSDGPLHGYAIIASVRERTDGELQLTASTLYDAVARLLDRGWLEEVEAPEDVRNQDSRRRFYQLTVTGRRAATDEAKRLERLIAMARSKRLLPSRRA